MDICGIPLTLVTLFYIILRGFLHSRPPVPLGKGPYMLETFLQYDSHKRPHAALLIKVPWLLGVLIINMALSKSACITSTPQTANNEG